MSLAKKKYVKKYLTINIVQTNANVTQSIESVGSMEPNLNPPVDEKLERLSDYVDSLSREDLAIDILGYGLDEKVKETILELEIPNANDFMREVVEKSNLNFLLKLVSKKCVEEIKETLIDYLYWRDETWDS